MPSPNVDPSCFQVPAFQGQARIAASTHPAKVLMLYGSLRERSSGKLLTLEAARLLKFTLLTRDVSPYLVDRYNERKETADGLSRRVN